MPDALCPLGLQQTRPLCPSPSSEVCPSSCPFHWRCHLPISSSDTLFPFWPQSFPTSGTFSMNRLFTSDDQNTGASASASVLPANIQGLRSLKMNSEEKAMAFHSSTLAWKIPWTAAHQASLSLTICQRLSKFMSIASVMPSSHLILMSSSPSALNLFPHQGFLQCVSY